MKKTAKNTKTATVQDISENLPSYHKITIIDTAGNKIETYSTYGKEGEVVKLDSCPLSHPAWNPSSNAINTKVDQVVKFANKYADFSGALSAVLNKDNK